MTISLIKAFRGLYRLCQCGCKGFVKIICSKNGRFIRYIKGHHDRKSKKPRKPKIYRTTNGGYYVIYKPYYPFSHPKTGYAKEHRYIMYIYLSILNNKVTYLDKNDDVHHINGNKKDNRIENLELILHGNHSKITYKDNKKLKEYLSSLEIIKLSKVCNICNTNKTKQWYNDINGFICSNCFMKIYHHRIKFGFSTTRY